MLKSGREEKGTERTKIANSRIANHRNCQPFQITPTASALEWLRYAMLSLAPRCHFGPKVEQGHLDTATTNKNGPPLPDPLPFGRGEGDGCSVGIRPGRTCALYRHRKGFEVMTCQRNIFLGH